jgi:hypothetical protein
MKNRTITLLCGTPASRAHYGRTSGSVNTATTLCLFTENA